METKTTLRLWKWFRYGSVGAYAVVGFFIVWNIDGSFFCNLNHGVMGAFVARAYAIVGYIVWGYRPNLLLLLLFLDDSKWSAHDEHKIEFVRHRDHSFLEHWLGPFSTNKFYGWPEETQDNHDPFVEQTRPSSKSSKNVSCFLKRWSERLLKRLLQSSVSWCCKNRRCEGWFSLLFFIVRSCVSSLIS